MVVLAHVENGQIVLDEPMELPEGARVVLRIVDEELSDDDRHELDAALEAAAGEIERGEVVSEAEMWARLQAAR